MPPQPPPTAAPSATPKHRTWLIVLLAALVTALAAALGFVLLRPTSQDPQASTPTAALLTAHGELQLDGVPADNPPGTRIVGAPCSATKAGYSDIRYGAQVKVTDAAGAVVGVGSLGRGVFMVDPGLGDPFRLCAFPFSVVDIPGGRGPYGVEVSHRGIVLFAEADLADEITLTLGS